MKRTILSFVFLISLMFDLLAADHGHSGSSRQSAFRDRLILRQIHEQNIMLRRLATEAQQRVAEQNAKAYYAKLPPEKKAALKKKKIRYLAVPTIRSKDTSPKAKEVVMIWDIPHETLISKTVYEQESAPSANQLASFDNVEAAYIGGVQ